MFENNGFGGVASVIAHVRNVQNDEKKKRRDRITSLVKATSGFEPLVQLLQSRALPLGDVALNGKRETGIEPATFSLARRCSTTEPLPHMYYPNAFALL